MKTIRVTQLGKRLAKCLRAVKVGQSITVVDRGTPIARIVPYEPESSGLVSRKPTSSVPFGKTPLPAPYPGDFDIVDILLEERQGHR